MDREGKPALRRSNFSDKGRFAAIWIAVLSMHVVAGWSMMYIDTASSHLRLQTSAVTVISLAPVKRSAFVLSVPVVLSPVQTIVDEPAIGPITRESTAQRQSQGVTIPPYPIVDSLPDTKAYSALAGLHEGTGGTVVLRVEVCGSGAIGRVAIDVSAGNKRIDRAAVAYIRAIKWVAGSVDGRPETMWIRWGVRLDG
jgi:TonB family protein